MDPRENRRLTALLLLTAVLSSTEAPSAADLEPRTSSAFDRYVTATEAQEARTLDDPSRFLWVDRQPDPIRRVKMQDLRAGKLLIERLETKINDRNVDVPGGLIHHWMGTVFVPDTSVDRAVALLQDYDRHATIYRPAVARSRLLARDGDTYRVFLRFFMKKGITVVMNSEHDARFARPSPTMAYSHIVSTRIAEVEHPDTAQEIEKPVGQGGGYLWRLNSDWRFLERDGGTYVQCESMTLTRGIPFGLGWLIGPFVTSIPRESLEFTLDATRAALVDNRRP